MKRYFIGLSAAALAVASAAFTVPHKNTLDPVYDWRVYNASGNPTSTYLDNKTVAEVQSANPSCNGSAVICFERYDAARTAPDGLLISKP